MVWVWKWVRVNLFTTYFYCYYFFVFCFALFDMRIRYGRSLFSHCDNFIPHIRRFIVPIFAWWWLETDLRRSWESNCKAINIIYICGINNELGMHFLGVCECEYVVCDCKSVKYTYCMCSCCTITVRDDCWVLYEYDWPYLYVVGIHI